MKRILIAAACVLSFASAQASYIAESEPNNSFGSAQNVNAFFSLDADALITNDTSWAHVSIRGNGNDDNSQTRDFYRFSTTGGNVLFDIDNGMFDLDSWLNLYDAGGALIGQHDDGGILDAGTAHEYDSYWQLFLAAGDYVVSVGRFADGELAAGQDYLLHISVDGHAVPEPSSMLLAGAALLGLCASRRKPAK